MTQNKEVTNNLKLIFPRLPYPLKISKTTIITKTNWTFGFYYNQRLLIHGQQTEIRQPLYSPSIYEILRYSRNHVHCHGAKRLDEGGASSWI